MNHALPLGYRIVRGSVRDRDRLLLWLDRAYRELRPTGYRPTAVAQLVDRYLSTDTPLFWLESVDPAGRADCLGGLWLAWASDAQAVGGQGQILWLYVVPDQRRRGLGRSLIQEAEAEVLRQGRSRLGLSVFADNAGAIAFYQRLGYGTDALSLSKSIEPGAIDSGPR